MILPDFILGGAPKCGTGSLFGWLSDHPQLRGSTPKEPFYFMDRDNPLMDPKLNFHRLGLGGWSRVFGDDLRQPGKLYFEGTTHLIYQETALSVLPGLSTRPKFIFLLRDPLARVASSFNYTQGNLARVKGTLTLERYFELLAAGDTATLRRLVLSEQSAYVLQRDLQYSNYWLYLQRWLNVLGAERMLVLQFERLIRQPLECIREVCKFLEISPDYFESGYDFSTRNATVKFASSRVHRLAQRVACRMPPGRAKRVLSRVYYWAQLRERDPFTTRPSARWCDELRRELEPGTRKLEEAFAIDLALWDSITLAPVGTRPRAAIRSAT